MRPRRDPAAAQERRGGAGRTTDHIGLPRGALKIGDGTHRDRKIEPLGDTARLVGAAVPDLHAADRRPNRAVRPDLTSTRLMHASGRPLRPSKRTNTVQRLESGGPFT